MLQRIWRRRLPRPPGIEDYEIIAELPGSELELMTAQHPLMDQESVVLCGDHVTLDAGSGCVHTAPGFGADDFNICQKYDKAGLTHIAFRFRSTPRVL